MQIDLKDHFIKALESEPNFSEAHFQLALLYKEEGDHGNVNKHFKLAISSYIKEAEKFEVRGDELLKNFQFQNAKDQFLKSQEKKIYCAQVYYQQALYFIDQDQNKSAESSLENSIKMNPLLSEAYRDLGILLFKLNQLDEGRFHLEKALDLNYADSISHMQLGKVMSIMNDFDDAEQHFLSALDINPKNIECIVEMAKLKLKMKQNRLAREYYLRAKKEAPDISCPELETIIN